MRLHFYQNNNMTPGQGKLISGFGFGLDCKTVVFGRLGGKRGVGVPGAGSRGTGSRGVENAGSAGKRGVCWKTRGPVENAGSGGKRGVRWKTRGLVENAGSGGKRGV